MSAGKNAGKLGMKRGLARANRRASRFLWEPAKHDLQPYAPYTFPYA